MVNSTRSLNEWAVLAAVVTHGINSFARDYNEAMTQIGYHDRNDTVVEQIAFAEQSTTPEQQRRFIVGQIATAADPDALKAVRRYCLRNRL